MNCCVFFHNYADFNSDFSNIFPTDVIVKESFSIDYLVQIEWYNLTIVTDPGKLLNGFSGIKDRSHFTCEIMQQYRKYYNIRYIKMMQGSNVSGVPYAGFYNGISPPPSSSSSPSATWTSNSGSSPGAGSERPRTMPSPRNLKSSKIRSLSLQTSRTWQSQQILFAIQTPTKPTGRPRRNPDGLSLTRTISMLPFPSATLCSFQFQLTNIQL